MKPCLLLFLFALCIGESQSQNLDSDLRGYLPFTNHFNDESIHDGSGLSFNGSAFGQDRFGGNFGAGLFDGLNDFVKIDLSNYRRVPVGALRVTISAWVKLSDSDVTKGSTIISSGVSLYKRRFALQVRPGRLSIIQMSHGNISFQFDANIPISVHDWTHIVVTNDNGDITIYINGEKIVFESNVRFYAGFYSDDYYIGALFLNGSSNPTMTDFFKGSIDDVRIYDRPIDDVEAATIYANLDPPSSKQSAGVWELEDQNIRYNLGNVTIGDVTTPTGYRLFVEEGILTEKVKISMKDESEWADFVFDRDYKLPPLLEVDSYIKANGHLPDIPSAEEVVDQGLDVAQINAKLLQKIEELTLYAIEQNQRISDLEQRIEHFKSN